MAAHHEPAVWLDDVHVATLDEPRSRQLRVGYTEDAVRRYGVNATVISASLPVRPKPHSVGDSRPVMEGLLPEGEARTRIENQLGIPGATTIGCWPRSARTVQGRSSYSRRGRNRSVSSVTSSHSRPPTWPRNSRTSPSTPSGSRTTYACRWQG